MCNDVIWIHLDYKYTMCWDAENTAMIAYKTRN
jgi:hypothetical protein